MVLNFYESSWALNESECPCDLYFNEWIAARSVAGKNIFHLGTGEHHVVGLFNAKLPRPNTVFGVTVSETEQLSYAKLVRSDVAVALAYKVVYADVYTLTDASLPTFDIVNLFHIGEYWEGADDGMEAPPSPDTPLSERGLIELLLQHTRPEGLVAFYQKSAGWERVAPVIDGLVQDGAFQLAETFRSLAFFHKTK
jgi:hypothetical protein